MTKINLYSQDYFSNAVDELRRLHYFEEPVINASTKDTLDDSSRHILAYCSQNLIGAIRLTINSTQADEKAATLTKAVIDRSWKRRELYKILMLEIVVMAFEMGCDRAVACVPLSIVIRNFLTSLGFEVVAEPTVLDNLRFDTTICEYIQLDLRRNIQKIIHARNELVTRFQTKNYHIISHY